MGSPVLRSQAPGNMGQVDGPLREGRSVSGKGSTQRPKAVEDDVFSANWALIFEDAAKEPATPTNTEQDAKDA